MVLDKDVCTAAVTELFAVTFILNKMAVRNVPFSMQSVQERLGTRPLPKLRVGPTCPHCRVQFPTGKEFPRQS